MDDMPVTLIVKAPNQQIEDQTIKCELSWNVKKLKNHIQEFYPSKPRIEDQKLIYSGQLLTDLLVLKDILRQYEGQDTHTIHLVCTNSKNFYRNAKSSVKKFTETISETPVITPPSTITSPSPAGNSGISLMAAQTNITSDNSVRTDDPSTSQYPRMTPTTLPTSSQSTNRIEDIQQSLKDQFQSISQAQYGLDSQVYAAQVAMFQQNYINYYNQYMQMYSNQYQSYVQRRNISLPDIPMAPGDDNRIPQVVDGRVPEPVPNMNLNVNPGEPDDGIIDRDWLDWFYVLIRLTVLFSIVYFYSSPMRFILVFVLGFAMYLYQVGFFRGQFDMNVHNNVDDLLAAENNNNRRNNNVEPQANIPREAGNDNQPPPPPPTPVEIPDRPTVLGVMWTFFTTFFASLIPEIPNAI